MTEEEEQEDSLLVSKEFAQSTKGNQDEELLQAESLSLRLLAIPDDDEVAQDRILRTSLRLDDDMKFSARESAMVRRASRASSLALLQEEDAPQSKLPRRNLWMLLATVLSCLVCFGWILWLLNYPEIGPPGQPIGPYQLLERQEGNDFFTYYDFYEGRDSVGSNGFNTYVSQNRARSIGIVNVTFSPGNNASSFVYMGSSPTSDGPRESIRLEGRRRFNRGLFVIDIHHMPVGCGVWPAIWLTDESQWPLNGEIDIVEGVNYQSRAKTALHSTRTCVMDDVPLGTMTGTWDTAQGIPDKKTGIPDMTLREARNCFVYDPRQWLNQGCVVMDSKGSLGIPLNNQGGGVFVLEWDPMNHHIRTWVFASHSQLPANLQASLDTVDNPERVAPDPDLWSLPYGFFPIGQGTNCPSNHFKHMRLVVNTAFCGSVAGNRFHLDCKQQVAANFSSCNEWIKSQPRDLKEAYWKIRGIYVYERKWEHIWSV